MTGVSKSLSIAILKDKLIDMRNVYDHVFSTRLKVHNNESNQWIEEINRRMLDIQYTIDELENQ